MQVRPCPLSALGTVLPCKNVIRRWTLGPCSRVLFLTLLSWLSDLGLCLSFPICKSGIVLVILVGVVVRNKYNNNVCVVLRTVPGT